MDKCLNDFYYIIRKYISQNYTLISKLKSKVIQYIIILLRKNKNWKTLRMLGASFNLTEDKSMHSKLLGTGS